MGKQWITAAGLALLMTAQGMGQWSEPTFSIDYRGPTNGQADPFLGLPITDADILCSPVPGPPIGTPVLGCPTPPGIALPWTALSVVPNQFNNIELDALSYGRDNVFEERPVAFSVDDFAVGAGGFPAPDVASEGAFGNQEAAADVFESLAPLALGPPGAPQPNVLRFDGDGFPPPALPTPGYGLVEPTPPGAGQGDNLDALNMDTTADDLFGPVYFSLDATVVDPITGVAGTGTAAANGFTGGDVLVAPPAAGGPAFVYASANQLGLDLLGGPDSDDLDALMLWDDGDMQYNPVVDLLLFSVRRGSAVIGQPDSLWGVPIEEGDILIEPGFGGGSPFPGVFMAAESLGLATWRSGLAQWGDDMDALSALRLLILGDVNGDGVVDGLDIQPFVDLLTGGGYQAEADINGDGVVDGLDIQPFVDIITGGGGSPTPEPATLSLLLLGALAVRRRRHR